MTRELIWTIVSHWMAFTCGVGAGFIACAFMLGSFDGPSAAHQQPGQPPHPDNDTAPDPIQRLKNDIGVR